MNNKQSFLLYPIVVLMVSSVSTLGNAAALERYSGTGLVARAESTPASQGTLCQFVLKQPDGKAFLGKVTRDSDPETTKGKIRNQASMTLCHTILQAYHSWMNVAVKGFILKKGSTVGDQPSSLGELAITDITYLNEPIPSGTISEDSFYCLDPKGRKNCSLQGTVAKVVNMGGSEFILMSGSPLCLAVIKINDEEKVLAEIKTPANYSERDADAQILIVQSMVETCNLLASALSHEEWVFLNGDFDEGLDEIGVNKINFLGDVDSEKMGNELPSAF